MTASMSGMRWVPRDKIIRVSGEHTLLPMVYVHDPRLSPRPVDGCAIEFSLPVAREMYQPRAFDELHYWPTYRGLTPGQRRYFLDWVRSECSYWPHELGYVFLYFYGLERRALIDGSDIEAVFGQVLHLRDYYERFAVPAGRVSRSFETYTTAFLWHLLVRFPASFDLVYVKAVFDQSVGISNDDDLAAVLSWMAAQGLTLPGWLAYFLAEVLPDSRRGVVLRRAGAEHRELFLKRFQEEFPNGMQYGSSKHARKFLYRPASAFLPSMTHEGPNPLGRPSQFTRLSSIWNNGIEDLKRFSSVVGKLAAGGPPATRTALTIAVWESLPPTLRETNEHPLADSVDAIYNAAKGEHSRAIVEVKSLASAHGYDCLKYSISQSRQIALLAEAAGLAVEPDARITNKKYTVSERVVLYPDKPSTLFDSARYLSAAYMMHIGIAIAAADGEVVEQETDLLSLHLRTVFELSPSEVKRLDAWKALLLDMKTTAEAVPRPPKSLDARHRTAFGQLILAMVAADGIVRPSEVAAARTLFARLGLDVAEVNRTFEGWSRSGNDQDMVSVQAARRGSTGEAIPAPPDAVAPAAAVFIDRAAVKRIMAETREVAHMLAEAMLSQESDSVEAATKPITAATSTGHEPPAPYTAFYRTVIKQEVWTREEFEALARQGGHMPAGAMEAINDWAYELYGGPLLYEDGDSVCVESSLLDA